MDPTLQNEPNETDETDSNDLGNDDSIDLIAKQSPPAPPAPEAPQARQGNVLTMPTSAIKRIKQEEREKGRREAIASLDQEAQALGFRDYASMKEAAVKRATAQTKQKPPAVDSQEDSDEVKHPRKLANLERQLAQAVENERRLNRARAQEERERRRLQALVEEKEAESELRMAAIENGIPKQYAKFALDILKDHLRELTSDQLRSFDENQYFRETLKVQHPVLYGVRAEPATTGANGGDSPVAAPKPKVTNVAPQGDADARKMTRDEYVKKLRALGLSDPATASTLTR